jgi:hypothetical protein
VHELGLQSFGLIPCADISRIGVELVVVEREFIPGVPFGGEPLSYVTQMAACNPGICSRLPPSEI